jgi:hypothetical protein
MSKRHEQVWEVACVWGHPWLGIMGWRLWLNETDYKTFIHFTIWEFSIGFSLPAHKFVAKGDMSDWHRKHLHPQTRSEILAGGWGSSFTGGPQWNPML